jgi:outer membrane protein assembly factor BamD (BamD/ComL family)
LDYKKQIEDEKLKSEGYARGLQFFSDGHYQEALAEFEDVAELDDNYIEVQDYIELSKAAMMDVSSYPQDILNLYNSGIALFVEKNYTEAIAEWEKILEEYPYHALARKNIKIAESRQKKLEELGINE